MVRRRRPLGHSGPVAIDDYTGFKVPLASLKKDWQGFMAVNPDARQPQDFVRGVRERIALPYSRPEVPDQGMASNILMEDGTPIYTEDGGALLTEGALVVL